jgi:hypothetical protein
VASSSISSPLFSFLRQRVLHRLAETLISIIYPTAEKNKKLVLGFLTIENGENKSNTSRSFVASLFEHKKFIFVLFFLVVVFVTFPFFSSRYIYSIITICLEKELDGKRNDWQRILYTE